MTPIGIKLSLQGQQEVSTGLRQVGQDVDRLSSAGAKMGSLSQGMQDSAMSAGQLKMAMQQLPMQFQDIVVSLQAGQAPMTVMLQQGSQLAGSFGGVAAAAKAMAGYVVGLVNPFTVAAAAVGSLAVAYYQGSKEQEAWAKAMITSGNAVGVTSSELRAYAQQIESVVGTQRQAAMGLADMVQAGVVGGQQLRQYTQAAIEWENATGQAVAATAKQFKSLGDEPLAAVLKLNEGTNFLTVSLYEEIKALEEQGRVTEASKAAQDGYAAMLNQRSEEIKKSLGTLEQAWAGVSSWAKKAWDSMLNVGREETVMQKIAKVQAELDRRQASPWGIDAHDEKGIAKLQQRLLLLWDVANAELLDAVAKEQNAKATKAAVEWDKLREQNLDKQEQKLKALTAAQNAYTSKLDTLSPSDVASRTALEKEYEKVVASINERYKERTKNSNAYARELEQQQALQAKLGGLSSTFYKDWDRLNKMYAQGRVDLDGLLKLQAELLEQQPAMRERAREEEKALRELERAHEADARALQKVLEQRERSLQTVTEAVQRAKDEEQAASMAAAAGITHAQAMAQLAAARADDAYMQAVANGEAPRTLDFLERERKARRALVEVMGERGVREANEKAAKDAAREWERTVQTIGNTLSDYIMSGGEDAATYLKRLFSTLVLQPIVQYGAQTVMGALGMGDSASTGGKASNAMSLLSNVQTMYSALSGNLVQSIATGMSTIGKTLGSQAASSFAAGMKGATLAEGLAGPTTAGASGSMGAGASAAKLMSTAWPLAIVAGMVASNKLYDAGYTANSRDGISKTLGIGNQLETNVLGKLVGDKVANILTGAPVMSYVFSSLFGRKLKDQGIEGTFGGSDGFSGNSYAYYKGGLFSSSKTVRSALDADTQSDLSSQFLNIRNAVHAFGDALGLASNSINAATYSIQMSLSGLSEDEINTRLGEKFSEMADSMAQMTLATSAYSLAEERRYDTLSRLATHLSAFNVALEALGLSAYDASVVAADGAYKIITALGGLDAYGSAMDGYYQAFYSDAEKIDLITKQMSKTFAAYGEALPETADGYREMVERYIAASESGDASAVAFTATLLQLAPTFKQVSDALKSELSDMLSAVNTVFDGIAERTASLRDDIAQSRAEITRQEGVLTASEIASAIKSVTVGSLSTLASNSAQTALERAMSQVAAREGDLVRAQTAASGGSAKLQQADRLTGDLEKQARDLVATYLRHGNLQWGLRVQAPTNIAQKAVYEDSLSGRLNAISGISKTEILEFAKLLAERGTSGLGGGLGSTQSYTKKLADYQNAVVAEQSNLTRAAQLREQAAKLTEKVAAAEAALAIARAAQSSAAEANQSAQEKYAKEAAKLASDVSAGADKLSALREQTVALYESQVQATQQMLSMLGVVRSAAQDAIATIQKPESVDWKTLNADVQTALKNAKNAVKAGSTAGSDAIEWLSSLQSDVLAYYQQHKQALAELLSQVASVRSGVQSAMESIKAPDTLKWSDINKEGAAAIKAAQKSANEQTLQGLADVQTKVLAYYEQQKQAVEQLRVSAERLRDVVSDVRRSTLTESDAAKSLLAEYQKTYALALSTTGSTRAGYADDMAAQLPALAQALKGQAATAAEWRIEVGKLTAQAGKVSTKLEGEADKDAYEARSLGLLEKLDSTLADIAKKAESDSTAATKSLTLLTQMDKVLSKLETKVSGSTKAQDQAVKLLDAIDASLLKLQKSSDSAEKVITDAINAGSSSTLKGLRAVVAAIKGEKVPAFAAGGFHAGGARLVGELGPEIEVTGAARYWSAQQTAEILGGGGMGTAVVAELRALRDDMRRLGTEDLRWLQRVARLIERWEAEGMPWVREGAVA